MVTYADLVKYINDSETCRFSKSSSRRIDLHLWKAQKSFMRINKLSLIRGIMNDAGFDCKIPKFK